MGRISLSIVPGKRGQFLLVNVRTGEQLGKLDKNEIWDGRKVKHIDIISSDQLEYQDERDSKHFGKIKTFKPYSNYIKENMKALELLRKDGNMSKADWTIYSIMKEHASCLSNYIKKSKSRYMEQNDILELSGLGDSTVYKSMKHLSELDIYKKDGNRMVLNPYVAYKGTEVSTHTEELFKNTRYKEY